MTLRMEFCLCERQLLSQSQKYFLFIGYALITIKANGQFLLMKQQIPNNTPVEIQSSRSLSRYFGAQQLYLIYVELDVCEGVYSWQWVCKVGYILTKRVNNESRRWLVPRAGVTTPIMSSGDPFVLASLTTSSVQTFGAWPVMVSLSQLKWSFMCKP